MYIAKCHENESQFSMTRQVSTMGRINRIAKRYTRANQHESKTMIGI